MLQMDTTITQSASPSTTSTGAITYKKSSPHAGSSFGGINNVAQPAGAKAILGQGYEGQCGEGGVGEDDDFVRNDEGCGAAGGVDQWDYDNHPFIYKQGQFDQPLGTLCPRRMEVAVRVAFVRSAERIPQGRAIEVRTEDAGRTGNMGGVGLS
jgi:hypothetical protein